MEESTQPKQNTVPKSDKIEQAIEGYTTELLGKTSLTIAEVKEFFEVFLSFVFLDSGKQLKFENLCIRYTRYEDELTDYVKKCMDVFGIDLEREEVPIKPDSIDVKVKQLDAWINTLSDMPFSYKQSPLLAKIQKMDWTQQNLLEKLVEMNAVFVTKQLIIGVDIFERIKTKKTVSMELLLPMYSTCRNFLDTLSTMVQSKKERLDLMSREIILESMTFMKEKIDAYYAFMVEHFNTVPHDTLEQLYIQSMEVNAQLTGFLQEYPMTPMNPQRRENGLRIRHLIEVLRRNYERVIAMEKKWVKTVRGNDRMLDAMDIFLNGDDLDDIALITIILMKLQNLKGDVEAHDTPIQTTQGNAEGQNAKNAEAQVETLPKAEGNGDTDSAAFVPISRLPSSLPRIKNGPETGPKENPIERR